jgi:hypothetical protein
VCQSCIITRYPTYLPSNRVICYDCLRPRYIHRHPQILYSDNTPEPVIERAATQSRTRSSAKGVVRSISPPPDKTPGKSAVMSRSYVHHPKQLPAHPPNYSVPCVDRIGAQVQMQDPRSLPIIIPHHSDRGGGVTALVVGDYLIMFSAHAISIRRSRRLLRKRGGNVIYRADGRFVELWSWWDRYMTSLNAGNKRASRSWPSDNTWWIGIRRSAAYILVLQHIYRVYLCYSFRGVEPRPGSRDMCVDLSVLGKAISQLLWLRPSSPERRESRTLLVCL